MCEIGTVMKAVPLDLLNVPQYNQHANCARVKGPIDGTSTPPRESNTNEWYGIVRIDKQA